METPSKRLYIGGIGPSVTDIELTERFGKFGKVDGVEIISRKDEHGTPLKTFAYLNINVSDVDLKKCISTLNKTKWKGGLLQIEMAKESFLHRLSQERQAIQEKKKPKTESKPSFVQSLEEAGVQDFQMKSAVPGTEVPNHKNWVVSKFGRVLPVLHLKGNNQRKSIKYDPSKYCHNIKRFEDNSVEMTPVSQLTWQLEGGEDDMSKKRRGEFPVFKGPVTKKLKLPTQLDTKGLDQKQKLNITPRWGDRVIGQSSSTSPSIPPPNKINCRPGTSKKNSMFNDEYDSEEELRNIIENEKKVTKEDSAIVDDNNVEVVDDSFKVTYTSHWTPDKEPRSNAKDEEYDSADTDEIIAVSKSVQKIQDMDTTFKDDVIEQAVILTKKPKDKADSSKIQTQKPQRDAQCSADDESDSDSHEINIGKKNVKKHSLLDKEQKSRLNSSGFQMNKSNSKQSIKPAPDHKSDSDNQNDDSASDSNASYSDEEYKSMIQNCYNLSLSMADLEKLASEAKESSNDEAENTNVESQPEGKKTPQKLKTGSVTPKVKKGLTPDDIVASILADNDDSADDRRKKKKKPVSPLNLPAFRGLGSLLTSAPSQESAVSPNSLVSTSIVKSAISKGNELQRSINNDAVSSTKQTAIESDSDSKAGQDYTLSKIQGNQAVKINMRSSSSSEPTSSDEGSSSLSSPSSLRNALQQITPEKSAKNEKSKRRGVTKKLEDNKKRLAAMEERRVERELQKKAIQGALLKSDSKPSIKSQHIKFDSDSELENEEEEEEEMKESDLVIVSPKKVQNATTKLFDSSDDESDEAHNKDDVERFQVRSRFEGQAGVKLMNLQSRFGTDERFRMDSRFLDSSSEDEAAKDPEQKAETNEGEELFAEKRKNLDIINSVLNINPEPQPPSKQTAKAKKFKDLNSLHYDPTKDEHTTFETEEKKEGKSERKKKRQEAEKLPEVSTDTYHEVMVDFKDVFGASTPATTNEDHSTTWDQTEESEAVGAGDLVNHEYFNVQKEEAPTGFTFSFFGASTQDSVCKEVPYMVETIKPGRVAWHEDPRFQDSSSEGEEEDDNAALDKDPAPSLQSGASKSNIRFFFFVKDDERLKVGPKMFFRTSNLDEEQEVWVGRRESLLEECMKRHKDAKRKIKAKH